MVNYQRIVCGLTLAIALVQAAPTEPCRHDKETYFDQRQNGTENYRLNIDGVVIAIAPAESLIAAASEIDFSDLLESDDFNEVQKPSSSKPDAADLKPGASTERPAEASPKAEGMEGKREKARKKAERGQRIKHRLANILMPLLRKNRHQ